MEENTTQAQKILTKKNLMKKTEIVITTTIKTKKILVTVNKLT